MHLINPLSCLSFPNELGSSWVHKDSNSKHGALGHSPGQRGHDSEVTHSHSQTSPKVTFVHNTNIPEPSGQMTYSAGPCPGAPGMPPKSDSTPVLPRDLPGQASLRSALEVLVFLYCLSSPECWADGETARRWGRSGQEAGGTSVYLLERVLRFSQLAMHSFSKAVTRGGRNLASGTTFGELLRAPRIVLRLRNE